MRELIGPTLGTIMGVLVIAACGGDDDDLATNIGQDASLFDVARADVGSTERRAAVPARPPAEARCVDTQLDPKNCGSCGKACAQGEVCSNGACALTCTGGTTKCGARCVDIQVDPQELRRLRAREGDGGESNTCSLVCQNGTCQATCLPTQVLCGKCVDPATDRAFCGATGNCGVGGAGACRYCLR